MKDIKDLRKGQVVINKVTKEAAVVTGIDPETGIANIAYATGFITNVDEAELTGKKGEITAGNCICFRIVRESDEPLPVPDASVKDGILTVNGKTVQQGELKFDALVGKLPGTVLLVAAPNKDGKAHVVSYIPDADKFASILDIEDGGSLYSKAVGDAILLYGDTREKVGTKDEDGNAEEKTLFKGASLCIAMVQDNRLVTRRTGLDSPLGQYEAVVNEGGETCYVFASHEDVTDGQGESEAPEVYAMDDGIYATLVKTNADGCFSGYNRIEMKGSSLDTVTRDISGSYLVKTDEAICYENTGHRARFVEDEDAVAKLKGYDTLVSCSIRNSSFSLTLANADLKAATVTVTNSGDARGNITEVALPGDKG